MSQKFHPNRVEAAQRYAKGDKSDPFAFDRVMSHMANGIAGFTSNGEDAFYTADEAKEDRVTMTGEHYKVTVYRNMQRP